MDIHALDSIFNSMVRSVNESKNDIFIINEESRRQLSDLREELRKTDDEISRAIIEGERLQMASVAAREKLQHVSMFFSDYTKEEVRETYDSAHEVQMEFMLNSTRLRQLESVKAQIENRIHTYEESIRRSDQLASHVNVVMKYLASELRDVGPALETAKLRKNMSMRVIEAQEEERKRLAREIHDGPAQMMANLVMQLGLVERVFQDKGMDPGLEQLGFTKELARNTLSEVRRIIHDLRPMVLDDFGLIPALRKYLERTADYHEGIRFNFKSEGISVRPNPGVEVAVFRLVQEAVTNAVKHSGARTIDVHVETCKDIIRATVTDDGRGFDPEDRSETAFGIQGMYERVALLRGEMDIRSAAGKGTEVILILPHAQSINK
ncbi:sensor histidine kinase [Bhargavaea ullalensis]|uniref:sensor histidine kinase n=1 Tax=Bhargavaea ullalensis TaxID=1265685 RepID=UPI003397ECF2